MQLAAPFAMLQATTQAPQWSGSFASSLSQPLAASPSQSANPAEQDTVRQAFVTCATGNGRFGFDHRIRMADGNVVCLHQEAELVAGTGGPADRVVIVTLQDLTRLHRAEETVRLLSYFDTVTGLPNRRHLSEQVAAALQDVATTASSGVVAFRVHDFARITQAHGGQLADRVLVQLAAHPSYPRALQSLLRRKHD